MNEPILITGAARSGTSMIAGIIHMSGAFGGLMRGPNQYNEKGMFENIQIVQGIVKPYLRSIGMDPLGQYPLPDPANLPIPRNLRQQIIDIMLTEGYRGGPWFYKGAKLCLVWPIWHYAFPNAKWIIVRRRTGDIVQSCVKTKFMRAFRREVYQQAIGVNSVEDGWIWWVRQHEKRFVEMIETGVNVKIVWPERMVHGDYTQIYEVIEWLGLKWDATKYLDFVDPKLWKARLMRKQEGKVSVG